MAGERKEHKGMQGFKGRVYRETITSSGWAAGVATAASRSSSLHWLSSRCSRRAV